MGNKKDDEFWELKRRAAEQQRDRLRNNAQWTSPADKQKQINKDDKAWDQDMQKLLNEDLAKLSPAELEKRLNETYRQANKRGGKLTRGQKAAAKRAAQQAQEQQQKNKSGWCLWLFLGMVLIPAAGAYGLFELLA